MGKTTYLKLECPRCHSPAHARVNKKVYKFLIYRCPFCGSNVVYYENHVDILSDGFVSSLTESKDLTFCGDASFPMISSSDSNIKEREITHDFLLDLHILLKTETDFNKLISQI